MTQRIEGALQKQNARFAHPPHKPYSTLEMGQRIIACIEDFYDFKNHLAHPQQFPALDLKVEKRLAPLLDDFLKMAWVKKVHSSKYEQSNAEAFDYIKGTWLEEYVWHVANLAGMDEAVFNQEIAWFEPGEVDFAKNEIDLIACRGDQFLLMSCKTMDPMPTGHTLTRKNGDLSDQAKEVAYWVDHFFPHSAVGTLVATLDMVDEHKNKDRYPIAEVRAQKQNIDILGVEDLHTQKLVEYFQDSRHW